MTQVTIIIPTFNRKDTLIKCLNHLCHQEFPVSSFTVIIVDDGSTDGTEKEVAKAQTPYRKSCIRKKQGGPASARNCGVSMAEGDLILFLDDDVMAAPSLLAEHVKMHDEIPEAMVMGKVLPLPGTGILNMKLQDFNYKDFRHGQVLEYNAVSANLSIRRDHFNQSGGFDERFTGAGCEDTELGFRLTSQLGLKLIFNEKALAYHDKVLDVRHFARTLFHSARYLVWAFQMSPGMLSPRFSRDLSHAFHKLVACSRDFEPLTIEVRDALLKAVESDEKLIGEKAEPAVEGRLCARYDFIKSYVFREGIHAECQKLQREHSLLEFRRGTRNPQLCLTGIPITITSPLNAPYSCERLERNLRTELARRGFLISGNPADAPSYPFICLSLNLPGKSSNPCTIGYAALETMILSEKLVTLLNAMDEVWVLTSFDRKVFLDRGVTSPLFIAPFGVDRKAFRPSPSSKIFDSRSDYIFLNTEPWACHSGLDILSRAYFEEFCASDDVCLVLATDNRAGQASGAIKKTISALKKRLTKHKPPGVIVKEIHSHDSMASLYTMADAYVNTNKAGAFCPPVLEAMACGIPVISANYGGLSGYLNDANAFLLEYRMADKNDRTTGKGWQWAEPSIRNARSMMRYAYEHREEAHRKAGKARQDFLKGWTLKHSGEIVAGRLWEIYRRKSSE
jgi:GT2 family glycosyltransferase